MGAAAALNLPSNLGFKMKLTIDGFAGGPFTILGEGFGKDKGKVMFNGELVETITSWSPTRVKGQLSTGAKPGEVVVIAADGSTAKGTWPQPPRGAFVPAPVAAAPVAAATTPAPAKVEPAKAEPVK